MSIQPGYKLGILLIVLLGACTESELYHRSRSPAQADRVSFRGEVCTEDPRISHFPLKVVLLVDQADGVDPLLGTVTGGLFSTFDAELRRRRDSELRKRTDSELRKKTDSELRKRRDSELRRRTD